MVTSVSIMRTLIITQQIPNYFCLYRFVILQMEPGRARSQVSAAGMSQISPFELQICKTWHCLCSKQCLGKGLYPCYFSVFFFFFFFQIIQCFHNLTWLDIKSQRAEFFKIKLSLMITFLVQTLCHWQKENIYPKATYLFYILRNCSP